MILVGDIGGTKTNLALFEDAGDAPNLPRAQSSYRSAKYDSLEAIIKLFIEEYRPEKISSACFGIAGPVVDDQVKAANLAWRVEGAMLARVLGIKRVYLINDLEATASGIEVLAPDRIYTLNEGAGSPAGHRALIAAGTGLGMAGILREGAHFHPLSSEGGHVDFAPRTTIEIELLLHLRRKFDGRVSYERVLSGPGLVNIYQFLRDAGHAEEPAWLACEIAESDDAASRIGAAALARKCELAERALDIFVEIYGAAAGNLALVLKPSGGLYIGGGIAPKILERLQDGRFMRAYTDKGRMSELVSSFPVRVILDDKTALYGAVQHARSRSNGNLSNI